MLNVKYQLSKMLYYLTVVYDFVLNAEVEETQIVGVTSKELFLQVWNNFIERINDPEIPENGRMSVEDINILHALCLSGIEFIKHAYKEPRMVVYSTEQGTNVTITNIELAERLTGMLQEVYKTGNPDKQN